MDEVRHIYMMDNDKAGRIRKISSDSSGGGPLHVNDPRSIQWRIVADGNERYDPETAHTRAGDPGYEVRLPETCGQCYAAAIAQASYIANEEEA